MHKPDRQVRTKSLTLTPPAAHPARRGSGGATRGLP